MNMSKHEDCVCTVNVYYVEEAEEKVQLVFVPVPNCVIQQIQ